ncbi:rab GDP-dissociation inhibitor [Trichophyton equinum CBS 127.97]|uniref:Rab GDP dissociation inhibitor n=1 Tax=Trichophyton equinum (strain ATCC MYA-4606 / CBS 127.97) TaxID=559882 RepID=F2PWG3_TRIEC|nr:rab GDP-dissociation inhibitor [Trichophyton equinum CBS 127.97]
MEEMSPEYDVIVMGTGLTECVLSGVLSVKGQKVLHIDRNDHYGGEAASVNIETLFRKFRTFKPEEKPWAKYGRVNDWNVDLVPKLLMSNGELTNILVSTEVTKYLDFRQIAGSYVQQGDGPKATVAKVPSDAGEALRSSLMGMFEKRRAKKFLEWVGEFNEQNPSTHQGLNMATCTMKDVYDKFSLETTTRDFVGHSMALYQSDDYISESGKAAETINRIRLYVNSMARYGKSPYIYPLYGLGELPQGFARLSAIHGGTYMLNANVDEVLYENGKVSGIKATMKERGEPGEGFSFTTKTKKIIADPSYFPQKTKVVGHLRGNHHLELKPGLDRLGKIEEMFMGPPIPLYEPLEDGKSDNIYISKSYDSTSHFETTTDDVRDIYERCEGHKLVVEGLKEGETLVGEDQ